MKHARPTVNARSDGRPSKASTWKPLKDLLPISTTSRREQFLTAKCASFARVKDSRPTVRRTRFCSPSSTKDSTLWKQSLLMRIVSSAGTSSSLKSSVECSEFCPTTRDFNAVQFTTAKVPALWKDSEPTVTLTSAGRSRSTRRFALWKHFEPKEALCSSGVSLIVSCSPYLKASVSSSLNRGQFLTVKALEDRKESP